MTSIRTNAHPVIMCSCPTRGSCACNNPNIILAYFRDTYDSYDGTHYFHELVYTTQLLRVDYDSPRIGGGLDPDVCVLGYGASLENERDEEGTFANYLLGTADEPTGVFDNLTAAQVQDMIVHAEAVALTWLAVFGEEV